jgi:hypothetical protein
MGTIIVAKNRLALDSIDKLLGFERMPSLHTISRLGFVLRYNGIEPVRILHPSFIDFLSNSRRRKWYIDMDLHNRQFTLHCLDYLNRVMRQNMCSLILSPASAVGANLEPEVLYACTFWIEHVCAITVDVVACRDRLEAFVFKHLLHWMEAMCIVQKSRATIGLLKALVNWIHVSVCVYHSPQL